jgi:nucleotide-binding universal stress UspA family protein
MYTTLLWATDGSPEADLALSEALELLAPGGRLVAFHCDQRFWRDRAAGAPVLADEFDRRRHIEEQVEELRAAGIDAEVDVETAYHGTPREIGAVADHAGADAIVCGTHGVGGPFGLLTGSVAADLLRRATVPVIVVPARTARKVTSATIRRRAEHVATHATFIG